MHFSHCNFNSKSVHSLRDDTAESFHFLLFFTPKQRKISANNRFHVKLVKYSNFYDIFANVDPFLMKFHVARHIHLAKLMSDLNIDNFKIQVDRWRPTRKLRKISIYFHSLPQNSEKSANNRFHVKLVKKLLNVISQKLFH